MRLSADTQDRLPRAVEKPGYDRQAQRTGIVHLGIGAFHRAHQAVYTDGAMTAGDCDWAITGVSLRSPSVRDALAPQDGLYTVTEGGAGEARIRLIGSVRDVLVAPEQPERVSACLAAPDTKLVTITVTEKGYHLRPDGTLDDAAATDAGDTIYTLLAAALEQRRAAGLPGLTLVPCDNLPGNGRLLADALGSWLDRKDPALRAWFDAECACASTMVDRIVPAASDEALAATSAAIGLYDAAALTTEPFRQWVIEDRFAGPRPRWDLVGAQFVADVTPFETAKLRMLNGAHSALAYLGLAAGCRFVDEAIAQPAIRSLVEMLMREAAATIDTAPGQDLAAYGDALLVRFANPALKHRLSQIATDGSVKIGPRWLEPLAINRARGRPSPATLRALAAWLRHVRGDAHPVDDPKAAVLQQLWRDAGPDGICDAVFGARGLMPAPEALVASDVEDVTAQVIG